MNKQMNPEKPVLISKAAVLVGKTKEDIIGWIELGKIQMPHPNCVFLSEVRRLIIRLENTTNYQMFSTIKEETKFKLLGNE